MKKPQIGIYLSRKVGPGGSTKSVMALAAHWAKCFAVTLISREPTEWAKLQRFFDIDLSQVNLVQLPPLPPTLPSRLARRYPRGHIFFQAAVHRHQIRQICALQLDLFVNHTPDITMPPLAGRSLYLCTFPEQSPRQAAPIAQSTLRSKLYRYSKQWLTHTLYGCKSNSVLADYDLIIANSHFTQYWIGQRWSLPATVVYPPYDLIGMEQQKEKIICHAGRFETDYPLVSVHKHRGTLLELFKRLPELHRAGWELHFVGGLHGTPQDRAFVQGLREQLLHLEDLQAFLAIQPAMRSLEEQTDTAQPAFIPTLIADMHKVPCHLVTLSPCPIQRGTIEFVNVAFTYPDSDEPALANLSFSLAHGETVAVVGENGAGKSTLAMLLARLYVPTAGSIQVDGVDLQTLDPAVWQQQIGFVFQRFTLYEATVRENIAYGDWQQLLNHPDEVEEIARLAQAEELIEQLSEGYATMLGHHFGKRNLSGGQWQKLALARGLARTDARLLILDEPSASLDARAEYELFNHFKQAASGRTTVLISHRFSTIGMADRIMVLEKGRLIECGTHDALLTQGGHYAGLYHLHRQQYDSRAATVAVHSTQ